MKIWATYPSTYRKTEIDQIHQAVAAGESVSVVGLSGSGKSNLLGYLVFTNQTSQHYFFIDANQLIFPSAEHLLETCKTTLLKESGLELTSTTSTFQEILEKIFSIYSEKICLVIDRFDFLPPEEIRRCGANLRSLRDRFKYDLCFVLGTRFIIPPENEISELIFGNTIWLGTLSAEDAYWSINQYTKRKKLHWDPQTYQKIIEISFNYPSFLRAICEAHAAGCELNSEDLLSSPIIQRRINEFSSTNPTKQDLQNSGLTDHPWLIMDNHGGEILLTEKETLLLNCLIKGDEKIVEKDKIIQSVWPEDKIYQDGIRDDSLAQLVKRLRKKLEKNPKNTYQIITIIGRGYKLRK